MMRPDKYRRRQQAPRTDDRIRRQIAQEAARRLLPRLSSDPSSARLQEVEESDYYAAKRQAAAVLGRRIRPGDLPSDHEVREAALTLMRERPRSDRSAGVESPPEHDAEVRLIRLADHIDRFDLYRMRLLPLESVKLNPKTHPEGDALYHSLQVFELAREERPYDEEFLLAALLHDVGKAIDPSDHVAAGLLALEGAIPERTAWLIAHQHDALALRDGTLSPKARQALGDDPDAVDELVRLRQLDEAGRVPGAEVGTVDEALDYLKGLEDESYLKEHGLGPNSEPTDDD